MWGNLSLSYIFFNVLRKVTSFSADRGSSRFGPRSGPPGRSGGSHYMSHNGASQYNGGQHVYPLRSGGPTYSLGDNYQGRGSHPTASAQPPPANLGEKRNYSQSSLSSTGSYHQPAKVGRTNWNEAPPQSNGYSQAANAPAPWNGASHAWPQGGQPPPPPPPSAAKVAQNGNSYAAQQPQVSSTSYSQPAATAQAYPGSTTVPPPPPPPASKQQPAQAAQPAYGAQSAAYAQYMGQGMPAAYPQAPQAWPQQAWPSQAYPGY